jgi:membrane-associated phospholipid phosphatase
VIAVPERPQRAVVVASAAVVASLVAFAPHAVAAWKHDVHAWDERLSVAVHDAENRDTILNRYVDVLGLALHPLVSMIGIGAVLAVAAVQARRGDRRLALAMLVALVGAFLLVPVLKWLFARPAVDPGGKDGYTFPSGHAVRSAVEALLLCAAAWGTRWRWRVACVAAVVVFLIGVGVVYHEWHWASDVLGGWALAVAWVATVWLAFRPSLTWTGARR